MRTLKSALTICFCFLLLSFQNQLQADTVVIHPMADTTLQSALPGNNFGDGISFQAGGRRRGGAARGLFLFDVAGNVPAGATINSATLTLNVTATPSGGANSMFDLHRVLSSWGEGNNTDHGGAPADANEATWNNRFSPSTPWSTPGGDFAGTVSGSRSVAGIGAYGFASTASMVSDVQGWLNTPANNFGWILISESENTPTSIRRFGSRDSATSPTLAIDFTPVPEPGTLALLVVGSCGLGLMWFRNRRQI